jgi:hypothetical protein
VHGQLRNRWPCSSGAAGNERPFALSRINRAAPALERCNSRLRLRSGKRAPPLIRPRSAPLIDAVITYLPPDLRPHAAADLGRMQIGRVCNLSASESALYVRGFLENANGCVTLDGGGGGGKRHVRYDNFRNSGAERWEKGGAETTTKKKRRHVDSDALFVSTAARSRAELISTPPGQVISI